MAEKLPQKILKRISEVKNKRARLLLDTIARRGKITTEELKRAGYDHPPRAARDVRELGFRLITTRVKGSTGRFIAAYSLDLSASIEEKKSGRAQLPKKERDSIIAKAGSRCQICGATHDLQVDHRVPYEVAGELLRKKQDAFLVLDGSCNRRKSWACEHCENFTKLKRIGICQTCYWANPEEHAHVAMEQIRRLDLVWHGSEVPEFDAFREQCKRDRMSPSEAVKNMIESRKQ